ncbi:MAG: hypothetical protein BRD45_05305 [Bacteroidetes bacterium QS_8_64_10]|nr:MAG: hypothetical protein BRD45_05305 [Bacteroidetes bacterium QS_8_64_10]
MKTDEIVEELEEAARKMGREVRRERGDFGGGACRVGEQAVIVLNERHPPEAHLAVLAEALKGEADAVYLKPAVRAALEEAASDENAYAE